MRQFVHPDSSPRRRVLPLLAAGLLALSGLAVALPAGAATSGVPFGHLDQVAAATSGVKVIGWAIDPDSRKPIPVTVTADGHALGTVTASVNRPDVGRAYGGFGAVHGFASTFVLRSGRHQVCVTARNVGRTAPDKALGCRTVSVTARAFGAEQVTAAGPGGLHLTGWAADPDSAAAVHVYVTVDAHRVATLTANQVDTAAATAYPAGGTHHGYTAVVPAAAGPHQVCLSAADVTSSAAGTGVTTSLGCHAVTVAVSPVGHLAAVAHPAGSKTITVTGWAVDPETNSAISVRITVDSTPAVTVLANRAVPGLTTPFAGISTAHGFSHTFPVSGAAHRISVVAVNVGKGANVTIGTASVLPANATAPSAPRAVTAKAGPASALVTWRAPSATGGTPVTGYVVHAVPGPATAKAGPTATSVLVNGLQPGQAYRFTVAAVNLVGTSAASASTAAVHPSATPIGPVTTPALISTSRYIRDINGGSGDAAKTRAMGRADGAANPSNHRYLSLLQIGGQTGSGVILTATSTYVSYARTVAALESYLAGYASAQHANAPATIAIGTNNDIDVSSATGAIWARQVVAPLVTYAKRYPNITIAGADDIEPGFVGTVSASTAWVRGFLAATSAKFVFNGSADGCGWTKAHTACNNGWRAANLVWMAGALGSTRILSLPQIYNTTMARQWKYISITGIENGHKRLNFAGPLTEWTACHTQHGGCGSLTNNTAWSALWAQLQSDSRLVVSSLPYGTDLRIN